MKTRKLILLISILMVSMANVFGQEFSKDKTSPFASSVSQKASGNDYFFSKSIGTYSDLTGSISLNNNQLWDDPEYVIPIGFDFELFDLTIDSLYLGLGYGALLSSNTNMFMWPECHIIPFETDLIDRGDISGISQSPISYKLEGTAGNRIFKLEWKNAGFFDEGSSLGTLNDYINFQLWLFEGTNEIEIHFGPNMITNPSINYFGETGAIIGLAKETVNNVYAYLLAGNPSNPTLVNTPSFLNGTPADGTIYKFSTTTTSIENVNAIVATPKVFPNPTNGIFTVERITSEINTYKIADITGKIIQEGLLSDRIVTIDLSESANGLYLLKIGSETIRLIKE